MNLYSAYFFCGDLKIEECDFRETAKNYICNKNTSGIGFGYRRQINKNIIGVCIGGYCIATTRNDAISGIITQKEEEVLKLTKQIETLRNALSFGMGGER